MPRTPTNQRPSPAGPARILNPRGLLAALLFCALCAAPALAAQAPEAPTQAQEERSALLILPPEQSEQTHQSYAAALALVNGLNSLAAPGEALWHLDALELGTLEPGALEPGTLELSAPQPGLPEPGPKAGAEAAKLARQIAERKANLLLPADAQSLGILLNLRRLALENAAKNIPFPAELPLDLPLACLSADCLDSSFPAPDLAGGAVMHSAEFWKNRIQSFARAGSFRQPGYILPPTKGGGYPLKAAQSLMAQGLALGADGQVRLFPYEDLPGTSPEECREAIDFLFFDEIDALFLDYCPCFRPERPDYPELMALLRQRGIMPVALADTTLNGKGVILAPDREDLERRGKIMAKAVHSAFFAPGGPAPGGAGPVIALPGTEQIVFYLDSTVAEQMGFDPPVWLLSLSRDGEGEAGRK